ncbi:DUF4388 domain-containing protein [Desulfococcaceae bacterium HSG8]|nr:DUF4388 domain-containing protein [Desulfococcaceae bacterium HSG8]
MSSSEATIEIIGGDSCPLYKLGDELKLTGKALLPSHGKPTCLILAGDIMALLIKQEGMSVDDKTISDCSGCTGLIRFEYKKVKELPETESDGRHDNYIGAVVNLLGSFSIFKTLNEEEIKHIVSFLRLDRFSKGSVVLKKGEPGKKLFIIISGKVEVLGDGDVSIAVLGKGEVFGEMSLLSGDPVGATVKAVESSKVLYLNGEYFRKLLNKFPSLQIYLARLLVRRLARTNVIRSEELSSGMIGKLSDMPPSGLFQTLNLNQKTGMLTLELPKGSAKVFFREGELIRASYNKRRDREAFFELLKEKEGRFKFTPGVSSKAKGPAMGEFMGLLMEGVRRIDEGL